MTSNGHLCSLLKPDTDVQWSEIPFSFSLSEIYPSIVVTEVFADLTQPSQVFNYYDCGRDGYKMSDSTDRWNLVLRRDKAKSL